MGLIMDQGMSFAFETVFSYFQRRPDGTFKSKIDTIAALQEHGYFVILLFVGLADLFRTVSCKTVAELWLPKVAPAKEYPSTPVAS